jgi:cytoskeletal protein RodZ
MSQSAGEQLKQARLALHVSVKDITQATKIQPWVLEALEANRLHLSMSLVYVKGFLATYAKFLRLDPDTLMAQLFPDRPDEHEAGTPERPPLKRSESFAERALTLLNTLAPAWPLVRRVGMVAIGIASLVVLIKVNPFRFLPMTSTHHHEASLSVTTRQATPSETVLALQPSHPLELVIRARRTTWVSVKADGRLLAQQQLVAGSQETWKARRQLQVIVSTPAQVEVWLNGQSISPLAMAHAGRLDITHQRIKPLED